MSSDNDVRLDDIPIVQDFPDVFREDLPRLPPKSEMEFIIELMLRTTTISKALYHIVPLELKVLKIQLQEMLKKAL